MSVRQAGANEVSLIHDLAERAYGIYIERIGRRPAPMDDNYDDKIRKGQVFVADDDAIVGFIVLVPKADHMLLENVAVDPYHQGIGVGRSLLDYAEIHAAQFGFSEVRLYTNEAMTENLSFYPRLGYHETDRRIENDFHRVYYSKRLGLLNPSS